MKRFAMLAVTLACAASIGAHRAASAQAASSDQSACAPSGGLHFVCGLVNVEDFLPVDGGRWLVGSSLKAGSAGLYLIDTAAKTAKPVSLSIARDPDPTYRGCAAPRLDQLETHGLDAVPGRGGLTTVYAINHGGRESVEIFRLRAARNSAEWVGCVLLPPGANGNSVAALPHGGFVVTQFMDTRDKQAFQHIMARKITGVVYRWSPAKGFSAVPGTRLSGDNGIVVSRDGQWLIVNAYGTDEIYRVPLPASGERRSEAGAPRSESGDPQTGSGQGPSGSGDPRSGGGDVTHVKVDFHPDNLRWAQDGTLFVTGQFISPGSTTGPHDWATVRLDPRTMSVSPVAKEPGLPQFSDATSTVQIDGTLWFGTFRGDRIAYRAAPR